MFFNCISISCYLEANFGVSLLGYFFAWTFCLFFRFLRLWLLAPVLLLALEDLWFELEPKVILALVVVLALMPAVTLVLSHNIGDDLAVPLWLERIYCALWSSPKPVAHFTHFLSFVRDLFESQVLFSPQAGNKNLLFHHDYYFLV